MLGWDFSHTRAAMGFLMIASTPGRSVKDPVEVLARPHHTSLRCLQVERTPKGVSTSRQSESSQESEASSHHVEPPKPKLPLWAF